MPMSMDIYIYLDKKKFIWGNIEAFVFLFFFFLQILYSMHVKKIWSLLQEIFFVPKVIRFAIFSEFCDRNLGLKEGKNGKIF